MNRQFKNVMTIILSVITVLSISLFGACGNGNGTAVVPADEDKIIENADGTKSIRITNPSSFWSLSPYLVIEVKK